MLMKHFIFNTRQKLENVIPMIFKNTIKH